MKNRVYNINTFNFYRRQVKPEDLDRAFIRLIEKEEEKINAEKLANEKDNSKSEIKDVNNDENEIDTINNENNQRSTKNLSLNLIFPKLSMERIMKIRDLFLEFDADKNRTFDQDEIYIMFNMNKIPITLEEVIDLFGFSKRKKFLSFFDFIQLTVNEAFSSKFKKLIMEKIRYRTSKNDICPNDFSDMLSHLCEFGKLSPELKDKTKENQMEVITKEKTSNKDILDLGERSSFKRRSTKKKSLMGEIVQGLNGEQVNLRNIDFTNEKDINKIRENPNLIKKEREFRNFMEISNKKFLRFKDFLTKANLRDKILKKKEVLSQSLKTLNNLNPNMRRDYISYFPTENSLKNLKSNKIVTFPVKKKKIILPPIKYNSTERNLLSEKIKIKRNMYFKNYYNKHKLMKLFKNKINNKSNSPSLKEKSKEEKLKEKEYASILASFSLSNLNLPMFDSFSNNTRYKYFNNKNKYSENTFVTTGLYSNLNQLQKSIK